MDSGCIVLHYPNMAAAIPTYALYGETENLHDWLHWETIQSRSRLYGYRIAPHRHEQFFQVLSLTGGAADVVLDGTSFHIRGPAVVAVPALTVHGYAFSSDVTGIVLTLMEQDVAALGVKASEAQILPGSPAVSAALDGLLAEADSPAPYHDPAMRAHLALLFIALGRSRGRGASRRADAERARLHIEAFRQLVARQFRETRRLSDYASQVGISQTHLNRVCRQMLGASALEIIERRIALEARRQLLFSSLSIKQIGAELGYDDPAYFTRFVTRALGASPTAIRGAARNG